MPKGKRYEEFGVLGSDERGLQLRREDGGVWRLDADSAAWRLIGERVRVVGIRSDFNILDVQHIELA